jgi:PAS domain S-box-containing protein
MTNHPFFLFQSNLYWPEGESYDWDPDILWSNVIGDAFMVVTYFAIPIILALFIHRRKDLRFNLIFLVATLSLCAIALEHLIGIIGVWVPVYDTHGWVKLASGIVAFLTLIVLVEKFTTLLSIPSVEKLAETNRALQEVIEEQNKTEAALLEKQEELSIIFRHSPIGKAVLDMQGNWVDVNYKLVEMFGLSREEMLQTNFQALTYEEDLEHSVELMKSMINGEVETVEFEKRYYNKEGKLWYGLVHSSIMRTSEKRSFFVAQIVDITARKNREKAEELLKQQLEEEVEIRTRELKEANRDLKNFVYVLGHDFRAPLNNLHQLAEMLEEDLREEGVSAASVHALGLISNNAENMSNMLSDILNFSLANKQALNKETIDMKALVKEVYEECVLNCPPKQDASLHLTELPPAYGDVSAIKQVLNNLISNALKYSSKEKKSEIQAGGILVEDKVQFWIKDNGVGFDEKYKDKLFLLFQRLHAQRDFEGTGVGLAVSNRIVQKHGGKMWAESQMGQGATFYFELPVIRG